MAFIENTAFEVKVSNHEFDSIANVTGIFQNGDGDAEVCAAGFLCKRSALTPNEGYESYDIDNTNTWYMVAAEDSDDLLTPIYACNTFDVNMLSDGITGADYRIGTNTLGLAVPAGRRATYTQISFNNVNVYRFGVGNINGTLADETFFTIADGLLVPASAAPTTAGLPFFELVRTGPFTQGAYAGYGFVDVRARAFAIVASGGEG